MKASEQESSSGKSTDEIREQNHILIRIIRSTLALALVTIAFYTAAFGIYDEVYQRSITVGIAALLTILLKPLNAIYRPTSGFRRALFWLIDIGLAILIIAALFWFFKVYDALITGIYDYTTLDLAIAFGGIIVLLELTRRAFGFPLAIVASLSLVYAIFGRSLPWIFAHAGYSPLSVVRTTWYSFDGVFGLPVSVVLQIIFIFIVFGAVLNGTGVGSALLEAARAWTGGMAGGPAHAAVLGSSLFGVMSGSSIANVVGTGVFTIPLIKERGFSPKFAGALEASASTGGQIMPPIMGAAAFMVAELTGTPYLLVAVAAFFPALFYYGSLFAAVTVEARRLGIKPIPKEGRPILNRKDWLDLFMVFIPLMIIIFVLVSGRSAAMAGFWATIAVMAIAFFKSEIRRRPLIIVRAFVDAGERCGTLMVAVAAIGIVIAVMHLTGLGLRFSSLVLALSGDSLFLSLLLTAIACLILGMGLPTLPAYLIIIVVLGTSIENFGIPKIAVHLFVFYFGVMAQITPPVAMTAYAAAPISGSNPIATMITAIRLAFVGLIVPFIFVLYPSLLLIESFQWGEFLWNIVRLTLTIWLMTTVLAGFSKAKLMMPARIIRITLAVALFLPENYVQFLAALISVVLLIIEHLSSRQDLKVKKKKHVAGSIKNISLKKEDLL